MKKKVKLNKEDLAFALYILKGGINEK